MSETKYYREILEAVAYLRSIVEGNVDFAVYTGTGLSDILSSSNTQQTIPYSDIPFLTKPSVDGHSGELVVKNCAGLRIAIFKGRLHYYEGHDLLEVTRPVRIAQFWGIKNSIFINASGGLREDLRAGGVCAVEDHLFPWTDSPLRGLSLEDWGTRFPDPKNAYDASWNDIIEEISGTRPCTYVCLPGPHLETMAEINYWKKNGADLVGMSTIPEVLVAHQAGMRKAILSVVTNVFSQNDSNEVTLEEVIANAKKGVSEVDEILNAIFNSEIENQER